MLYVIVTALITWGVLYRLIALYVYRTRGLKGAVTVEGSHGLSAAPPPSAYRLLVRLGLTSTFILGVWCFVAFWESLDRQQAFLPILLQPILSPVKDSLVDLTIRVGFWLGAGFACLLAWIVRTEGRTGNRRVIARVRLLERGGKQIWLELTEPYAGAWPVGMAESIAQQKALTSWVDNTELAVAAFPYNREQFLHFQLNAPQSENDLTVREDDDD